MGSFASYSSSSISFFYIPLSSISLSFPLFPHTFLIDYGPVRHKLWKVWTDPDSFIKHTTRSLLYLILVLWYIRLHFQIIPVLVTVNTFQGFVRSLQVVCMHADFSGAGGGEEWECGFYADKFCGCRASVGIDNASVGRAWANLGTHTNLCPTQSSISQQLC